MKLARHLYQELRILFILDDVTGDFIKSHPTIFLPRPAVPPASNQDLRRSVRSHTSPVNPFTAYLKTIQGSKSEVMKKKKKDAKSKDQASGAKASHKCARTKEDATQVKDKPAPKNPKLKETVVIEDDECGFFLFFLRPLLNILFSCHSY